jgi:hypothetical protein
MIFSARMWAEGVGSTCFGPLWPLKPSGASDVVWESVHKVVNPIYNNVDGLNHLFLAKLGIVTGLFILGFTFFSSSKARGRNLQVLNRRLNKNKANLPRQVPVRQLQVCKKKIKLSIRPACGIVSTFG